MPRKTDSRERMVRSAAQLFRRQGYAATGWRQIVAESGAPWGSQAHFFPGGKEQLAAEALSAEGSRIRREMEAALEHSHPADMITAWSKYAARVLKTSKWAEGCPIATAALETAHTSTALARACDVAFASWVSTFERALIARGMKAAEAQALATTVVAATEGALLMARTARKAAPLETVGTELAKMLRARVP
jgi:TetR/AcrR family transcriptional repressor of lmrAB and yxaGH operons